MLNNYDFETSSSKKILNLINKVKEINKETDKKISEIKQSFFLKKIKKFNEYRDDWDHLFKETISKYNTDISTNKFNQIQQQIQINSENRAKQIEAYLKLINLTLQKCNSFIEVNNLLPNQISSVNKLIVLKSELELILNQSLINEEDLLVLKPLSQQVNEISNEVHSDVLKIVNENELKLKELKIRQLKDKELEEQKIKDDLEKQKLNEIKEVPSTNFEGFHDINDAQLFINLRKFNIELKSLINEFLLDDKYKSYRINLVQFIKTTINTISSNSLEHLKDKIRRLSTLFEQKNVDFKNAKLSTRDHKDALVYSLIQTAKAFLGVGMKQVLSSNKSSFPLAAAITILWSKFPLFGKILLTEFFDLCPYTAPYFPVCDSDNNELEFLIVCGYSLTKNNTLEDETTFLNRMRALIILYAAIIQTNYNKSLCGLRVGWKWLSTVLNAEPVSSINPAIIHSFLSIAGYRMHQVYGKQFKKLIIYINNIYLPKIAELNLPNRQPGQQLQNFIEGLMKKFKYNQNMEEPVGMIKLDFY